ncbi:FadR/GntR family transcriptional regulator [Gordonia sp. NPDC127522]|uniref:FadR/GntR family transcriptional regulator n=1 Tax=Gordonia sp. NPDC127522 TaxID=3345390 RepID=UPI003643494B
MTEPVGSEVPVPASNLPESGFTPVARPKRGHEYITAQIREAITSGRYRPGDRLPAEREMAAIFQVSRNGVREAMRGLESLGLIEIRLGVHGGAFVATGHHGMVTQSVKDLASLGALSADSLLEARILLTSDVLRLACERATEEDLERLEENIRVIERLRDQPDVRRARITEFYRLLAEATHNDVLVMLNDSLAQAVHVRIVRGGPPLLHHVGELRRRVVEHIRAGEPEPAIAAMTAHLRAVEDSMRDETPTALAEA